MNSHLPVSAVITSAEALTKNTTLFTLLTDRNSAVAAAFLPGQFLQLSLPGVGEIPISYCGYLSADGSIELCISHVGRVSTALKSAVPGASAGVRGPFGNGFPLSMYTGKDLLLIAGGLGMAPLRSLLLALRAERHRYGRVTLLYGAREAGALLFLDELREMKKCGAIELRLAVDRIESDSEPLPDCRIALLPALMDQLEVDPARTCAAICGPPVVYPYLVAGAHTLGVADERIHLSLERRMKCGIGRCGHCAVGGYLCCVDGPVFSYAELAGIEGALG